MEITRNSQLATRNSQLATFRCLRSSVSGLRSAISGLTLLAAQALNRIGKGGFNALETDGKEGNRDC